MKTKFRTFGVLAAAAMLTTSACGSDSTQDRAATLPSTTVAESPAARKEPGELQAALLTLADMPAGYTVDTEPDDDDDESSTQCPELDSLEEKFEAAEQAEITFNKGEPSLAGFAVFSEALGRFKTVGEAKSVMSGFVGGMTKCSSFDETDDDGTVTHGEFTPLSFPKLRDDTFAAHMKFTAKSGDPEFAMTFDAAGDLVVVRAGRILMLGFSISFGSAGVSAAELEQLMRKAAEKI